MEATLEGQKEYAIYHDLIIKSTLKEVFEAISLPKHLINWWPLKCSGSPKLGEVYNFYFAPEFDWFGKVIEVSMPHRFVIHMTTSDADWDSTTFGFSLSEEKDYIQVEFWHKGWSACNAHYRRSSYCWAILLQGLKNYVEKGIVVPFAERE